MNVILSAHARRQLADLGWAAEQALEELESLDKDELGWVAEPLPPQGGRDVWMLWCASVRVLFDVEDDDLTVHGFGKRPGRARRGAR